MVRHRKEIKMKVRENGEIYETALNGVWMPDGGFWPTPPLVPMTEPAEILMPSYEADDEFCCADAIRQAKRFFNFHASVVVKGIITHQ
jgi:hypothetical protein